MRSTLAKLSLCRTAALGGKTYQCDDCGEVTTVHHSCGDRHCPVCSGRKRYDFAARAEELILDDVTYYQVVFTLPSELSEMALANRTELAELLFTSAWKALQKTIRSQQDYDPAAMMVLHTWNQRMDSHWHVHALVPGAGPSLSHDGWKQAEAPEDVANSDGHYLVDAFSLREGFRKFAIRHLRRLRRDGKLKLGGKFTNLQNDDAWESFCEGLESVEWVSFIQPPPTEDASADQVVRYLTRYLTGGPISDRRIIAADRQQVTILAREGVRVGGDRQQVPVTMQIDDFTRRWCLHIQPDQLTKVRHFGGWSCRRRTAYMDRCREILESIAFDPAAWELDDADEPIDDLWLGDSIDDEDKDAIRCPSCDSDELRLISETPKPSWLRVLDHLDDRCPRWHAEAEKASLIEYLEREYGVDYDTWLLETRIESARGPVKPVAATQPLLPGMSPRGDMLVESY